MRHGRPRSAARAARTGPALVLAVEDEGWRALFGARLGALVEDAVFAAADRLGLAADIATELSVTLSDDAGVRALNARWRGVDRPTNILSFPMRPMRPGEAPGPLLGDLVLARQTLERESAAEGKAPGDHLRHLLVHGVLHCLGYDHGCDAAAEAMESLEVLILADLGVPDPYEAGPAPGTAGAPTPNAS